MQTISNLTSSFNNTDGARHGQGDRECQISVTKTIINSCEKGKQNLFRKDLSSWTAPGQLRYRSSCLDSDFVRKFGALRIDILFFFLPFQETPEPWVIFSWSFHSFFPYISLKGSVFAFR